MSPASGIVHDQAPMLSQHDATSSCSKDAVITWFRGEFAAANAIIDALCNHLSELHGGGSVYESTFAAIHRRRLNWIPILQMQKYYPITDVLVEIGNVTDKKRNVVEKCAAERTRGSGDEDQCYGNIGGLAKSEITNGVDHFSDKSQLCEVEAFQPRLGKSHSCAAPLMNMAQAML
ncbi:hypothetical protein ACET3Z_019222 [Daucus carota]